MNWKSKSLKLLGKYKIFEIYEEIMINPRNGKSIDFYYLDLSDWTVVIPVTDKNEIVMIKQYRVGAKKYFYEFPGGLIDKGECPSDAAKRELKEETGYFSEKLTLLSEVYPLPAFQTSKCYIYLAENVEFTGEISLDAGEDIETLILPVDKVKKMLNENMLDNSIMMLAFLLYLNKV
jgi:8-oxo-dGTP pyrophosphatase MutT (NUDIX family)